MPETASLIKEKINSKLIIEAETLLKIQGKDLSPEEYDDFHHQITSALATAESLVKKAKSAEQRGNVEEALNMLNQAKLIVADFPGLRKELIQINDAVHLTRTFKKKATKRAEQEIPVEPKKKSSSKLVYPLLTFLCLGTATGILFYLYNLKQQPVAPVIAITPQSSVGRIEKKNTTLIKDESGSKQATSEILTIKQEQPIDGSQEKPVEKQASTPSFAEEKIKKIKSLPVTETISNPPHQALPQENETIIVAKKVASQPQAEQKNVHKQSTPIASTNESLSNSTKKDTAQSLTEEKITKKQVQSAVTETPSNAVEPPPALATSPTPSKTTTKPHEINSAPVTTIENTQLKSDQENKVIEQVTASPLSKQKKEPEALTTYTIKAGDSLSLIADRLLCNEKEREKLFFINRDKLTDPAHLEPGTVIRLQSDEIKIENRCEN